MRFCSIKDIKYILVVYILTTLYLLLFTPLTTSEANIIYSSKFTLTNSILNFLMQFSSNKIVLRFPFFVLSILSISLFYLYLKSYFKKVEDVKLSLFIFILTPGFFVSNIIINWATIPILLTILLLFSVKYKNRLTIVLIIMLLFFTNTASFVVYIALFLYLFFKKRDYLIQILLIVAIFLYFYFNRFYIGGVPSGHFLKLMGIYAVTFSPFYFLAILYAIYRLYKDKDIDLLWYISIVSFILSIIFSIRQKILVTDFTPFFIISSLLVVKVFKNSMLIRLKEYRKKYIFLCKSVIFMLLLETLIVVLNYPIYIFIGIKLFIIDTNIYTIYNNSQKKEVKCIKDYSNHYKNLYKYYGFKECR